MSLPLSLPEPKEPKAPSLQLFICYVRLVGHLTWIWQELRMIPVALGFLAWALGSQGIAGFHSWILRGVLLVAVFDLGSSWLRGAFRKNVADTMAALVRCDWRIARLTKPTLPRLVKVQVHEPYSIRRACQRRREEGIWGIPAAAARIEFRPHAADQPTNAWVEQLEWWATNRYAFSSWETMPTRRSPHILGLDMGELVIPDMVTAGGWE